MRTPSLRGRVVLAGALTSTVLLVGVDLFVWFNLRDRLEENLDGLLESRAQLVREIGPGLSAFELDQRLTARGVPAVVRPPSGGSRDAEPGSRSQEGLPPAQPQEPGPQDIGREVELPDGTVVTVLASRAGVDATLQRVLLLELIGSLAAVALLVILLERTSTVALGPLDEVVHTARRIAAGRSGERLSPDRPGTELGRMATAFDEMLDALEDAVEQARAAERRSRAFLAQAAHQLRTPVTSLQTSVDALLRIDDPEQREELLDILAGETARTSRLVRRLLRLAELDDGPPTERTATDIDALIAEEVARAGDRRSDVTVEQHHTGVGAHPIVPDTYAEALANLLENAVRHAHRRVEVTVRHRGWWLEVTVLDDGPGVPEDARERIFERFVSLGVTGGVGLGLPIARSIARSHGGDVTTVPGGFLLRTTTDHPAPDETQEPA